MDKVMPSAFYANLKGEEFEMKDDERVGCK
jgi:hypothetical protein